MRRVPIYLKGGVGGSCTLTASDSCSGPKASCNWGTCEYNAGNYDGEGISNNNAETCTLRKYQFNLRVVSVEVVH